MSYARGRNIFSWTERHKDTISESRREKLMSNPLEGPRPERPSTYAIEDRNNEEELQRLTVQDHVATRLMGGPLSEQPDPARFTTVLDVGCGTGGWAITLAQQYPWMRVTGIDISGRMIS